ncbi:hypothetical protein L3Y34_019362 [Caenorhabditis briggsae]|uniref:Uncharacterized protein n=1 Tax=Caenorhabditis briggsae TaxID=6238 RepID=A0AAE9IW11_CAEBR|nr:hypothetical protein L3Y34_019362 [Caenorhabditis briggsae]
MSLCSSSVPVFGSSLNLNQAIEIARLRQQLANVSRQNEELQEEIVKLYFIQKVLETKKNFYIGCSQTAHRFLADERKTVEELREKCVCGKIEKKVEEVKKVKEEVFEDEECVPDMQKYVAVKTVKKEILDDFPLESTHRPAAGLKRRLSNVMEPSKKSRVVV